MSPRETQPAISDLRLERYRLGELPARGTQAVASAARRRPGAARRGSPHSSGRTATSRRPTRRARWPTAVRRRARRPARPPWRMPLTAARARLARARHRRRHVPVHRGRRRHRLAAAASRRRRHDHQGRRRGVAGAPPPDGGRQRGAEPRRGGPPGRPDRIGYRASGRAYGAIVSIDGRGNLTQHLPADRRTGGRTPALGNSVPRFRV